jgi:type I restriction enzyme S subunit
VLIPKDSIDSRFAVHWFKSPRMLYLLWAYSHGLTEDRLRLYFDDFCQIPATPPPLDEQRRIVAALDAWDGAIEFTNALTAAHRALYAGLRRELIDNAARQTARPGERRAAALGEITQINLKSLAERTDPDFLFQYFDISSEISDNERDESGWTTFQDAPSRARRLAEPGDLVYATVRPLLRRLFIANENPDAVYSTGYAILHPRPGTNSRFLYHAMTATTVERQIYAALTGSGYPAINAGDLTEIMVPAPVLHEQERIAAVLDAVDTVVKKSEEMRKALTLQKRGLMQKLLTGEWRLGEDIDCGMPTPAPLAAEAGIG